MTFNNSSVITYTKKFLSSWSCELKMVTVVFDSQQNFSIKTSEISFQNCFIDGLWVQVYWYEIKQGTLFVYQVERWVWRCVYEGWDPAGNLQQRVVCMKYA